MTGNEIAKFLRLLAHDLQNQLGAVDLNLQVMPSLAPESDPSMQLLLPFIARASMASQDLIETLGNVQSFASSICQSDDRDFFAPPRLSELNLSRKAQDTARVLAAAALERRIKLQTAINDGVKGLGESESVHRSIKILTSEALRSSFPESVVALSAFFSGLTPIIEVSTTQAGIFDEQRSMLSIILVRQLLNSAGVKLVFVETDARSSVQLHFQTA